MQSASSVHVGRPTIEGAITRYARSFDLLEILGEPGRHPRRPGLLEWRRVVPERFVFSIVVPSALASLEHRPDRAETLSHARMVADSLAADWWLVRTPPSVTPSARATRELSALISELRDERRIAWEPRGVWSDEEARRAAEQLGVYLVRDLSREERGDDQPIVYTRLRALGEGARVGAAAAERLAERLEGCADAYVVVEGAGAGRVRQVLREMAGLSNDAEQAEPFGATEEEGEEGEGDFSDDGGELEDDESDLEDE
jgi:uncharacterized protein YecE (DUF72 family)